MPQITMIWGSITLKNLIILQFIAACGYVADKIRGLCSGKSEGEEKGIKGIKERPCVISNGTGPKGNVIILKTGHPKNLL